MIPKCVVSKLSSDVKQEKIAELPFSSLKGMKGCRFKLFFRPLNQKDCRVFVVSRSISALKRRVFDRFFTFSGRRHYPRKVLLGRNGWAVLSSIVLYYFGLERHNCTKKDPPGVSFSAFFSDSRNKKRCRVFPFSGSLNT